ncbi:transglutaminase-like domain-containing protein, partial [Endozoicomonas sp. ONNA2]|uniref:transglutaminase-like domain-containing protein n=1 Tax=Endozoicomonas sp. ONNA2 TaxID=2828741 RepID=UPI00214754FC
MDFIIAPEQSYFTRLRPGEWLTLSEGLCSQRLADLLEEQIFYPKTNTCKAYAELCDINGVLDIPQRLRALMDWLATFSDSKNVTGQDEQLLLNMLREKQGVCRHKALIFQVLCLYWGIPARQVDNVSHRFVEISPDGGHTWRQYQLGGGGRSTADITEPDLGEYRQTDFSGQGGVVHYNQLIDLAGAPPELKINYCLVRLTYELQPGINGSVSTELMHIFKDSYSAFNRGPVDSNGLPDYWGILLSPQMFYRFGENIQDWEHIIEKSAWYMADAEGKIAGKQFLFTRCLPELCNLLHTQKPDVHYLNWLCDLYRSAPQFLKYVLLAILQTFSGSCDSCQLNDRVKLMLGTYPLSPLETDLDTSEEQGINSEGCSERCSKFIKTMTMSRSLLQRLSQPRVHQQRHYQPVGNSIIIPEKLMSGEA